MFDMILHQLSTFYTGDGYITKTCKPSQPACGPIHHSFHSNLSPTTNANVSSGYLSGNNIALSATQSDPTNSI